MPSNIGKMTAELASRARKQAGPEKLRVMLELAAPREEATPNVTGPHGGTAVQAMKQAFERQSRPLVEKVERLGGRLINSTFLSGSLEVELSGEALADVSRDEAVQRMDVVRRPERE